MKQHLLLIPIHVDALYLDADNLLIEPTADFSRLPFFNGKRDVNSDIAYVSENFISQPLQNQNQRFRAGLHLHWSLPDALTKGRHLANDQEGKPAQVDFPVVPNRWLIIRTINGQPDKKWVVESDFLWPEERDLNRIKDVKPGILNLLIPTLKELREIFLALGGGQPETQEDLITLRTILEGILGLLGEDVTNLPATSTMTVSSVENALTLAVSMLEKLEGQEPELEGILEPVLETLETIIETPDEFFLSQDEQESGSEQLAQSLAKTAQLIQQAQAFLSLVQQENQVAIDQLDAQKQQLNAQKLSVEANLAAEEVKLEEADKSSADNILRLNELEDDLIPQKEEQIKETNENLVAIRAEIFELKGLKSGKEDERFQKSNRSTQLEGEINDLIAELLPGQEERIGLLNTLLEIDQEGIITFTKDNVKNDVNGNPEHSEDEIAQIIISSLSGIYVKKKEIFEMGTSLNADERLELTAREEEVVAFKEAITNIVDASKVTELSNLVDAWSLPIDDWFVQRPETVSQLETLKETKEGEKTEKQGELDQLEADLENLQTGGFGLNDLTNDKAQKEGVRDDTKTTIETLAKNNVKEDGADDPIHTEDEIVEIISTSLTDIYEAKKEILELGQNLDFDQTKERDEKEAEIESLKRTITDILEDGKEDEEAQIIFQIDQWLSTMLSIDELTEQIQFVNNSIADIEKRLDGPAEEGIDPVRPIVNSLTAEIDELSTAIELKSLDEELKPEEKNLSEKQAEKAGLDLEIETLDLDIAGLADDIRQKELSEDGLESALGIQKGELAGFEQEVIDLESAILHGDERKVEIRAEIEKFKSQVVGLEVDIQLIEDKISAFEFSSREFIKRRKESITVPIQSNPAAEKRQPYRYMGRIVPANAHDPGQTSLFDYYEKLTAIGYGEPSFAAFYPNCRSVFGFHDDEAIPSEEGITYHIIGWYGNEQDDFLTGLLDGGDSLEEKLSALKEKVKWEVSHAGGASQFPARMLCFSKLEFKGSGLKKVDFQNQFKPQIAKLSTQIALAEEIEIPEDPTLMTAAEKVWNDLLAKNWIINPTDPAFDDFDALLLSKKGRLDLEPSLIVNPDIVVQVNANEVEKSLWAAAERSFSNTAVTVADTGTEALAAYLSNVLIPVPDVAERKRLEAELRIAIQDVEEKEEQYNFNLISQEKLKSAQDKRDALESDLDNLVKEVENEEVVNQEKRKIIEDQLEALFLTDQLNQRKLDIGAKFKEARLEKSFQAVATGRLWAIRMESDPGQNAQELAENDQPDIPLDNLLAIQLDELNNSQGQYDGSLFEIDTARQQLFADWYKYMLSAYPPADSRFKFPDIDEVRYFIQQKDLIPLYDKLMRTGRLLLDDQVAPTSAKAEPSLQEEAELLENLKVQLDKDFAIPEDYLAKRLSVQIRALIRGLSLENINRLQLQERAKQDDIKDWSLLVQKLIDPAGDAAIQGFKDQLPQSIQDLLEGLDPADISLTIENKEALRTALNDILLHEVNAMKSLVGRFVIPDDLFLSKLQQSDIDDWTDFLTELKNLGTNDPDSPIWSLLSVEIQQFILAHPITVELKEPEKNAIIAALNDTLGDRPAKLVRENRTRLEQAFPEAIRPGLKTLWVLKQIGAPRYWEPREPSVMVAGDMVKPSNRFGRDGRLNENGFLECVSREVDFGVEVENTLLPSALETLKAEIEALEDQTKEQIGFYRPVSGPWNPFSFEWEVEVLPLQIDSNVHDGEYQASYIMGNLDLPVGEVDLKVKAGRSAVITGRNPNIYNGRSLLSLQALKGMKNKLAAYLDGRDYSPPAEDSLDQFSRSTSYSHQGN